MMSKWQLASHLPISRTPISTPRVRLRFFDVSTRPPGTYLYMAGSSHFMVPFPKFGPCFMIQTLRYFATMMKP